MGGLRTLALALLAGAAPLAAQAEAERAQLAAFRADLRQTDDTAELRRLERALHPTNATDDSAVLVRLQRGITRLRLGEQGDGWSFGRAAGDFGDAADRRPEWPWPWYGTALAEHGRARWLAADPLNLGSRVGFGAEESALRAARRALTADPAFAPALEVLLQAAETLRDTAAMARDVVPAISTAWRAGDRSPPVVVALLRAARAAADTLALPMPLDSLLALVPATGLAGHELAWDGFLAGAPWADSVYYAAAARDDAEGFATYRAALRALEPDSLLAGFDAASGSARAAWLRDFWARQAAADLRDPAERLAEHYRRLAHAERHFALQLNRRFWAPNNLYRADQDRYDDRGVIWVRYGPPDDRVTLPLFGMPPLETWRYHRADGDLLLHFQAGGYSQGGTDFGAAIDDYRLVPTLFDGFYQRSTAWDLLLQSRCPLLEAYCKYLAWGPNGRAHLAAEELEISTSSAAVATTTSGWERRFARPLSAKAEAFAVGAAGDRTLLHLAFQLPVEVEEAAAPGALLRAPVHARLVVLGPDGAVIARADTVVGAGLPPGQPGLLQAFGRFEVAVPPGRWRYRLELAVGDSVGRVFPTDSVVAGRFSGVPLALSDLVLGRPGIGAPWVAAPGDTAYFTPRATWARGDTLTLYHEVYGLEPGTPYTVRLTIRRGRRPTLTTGWDGTATGPVTRVGRTVSLASLRKGDYALEVRVSAAGGEATAARRVTITE